MSESDKSVEASCLCGNANHSISLPQSSYPWPTYHCHCNSCRHYCGTLFMSIAFIPKPYAPEPSLLQRLRSFEFSSRITAYFCPTCGTKVILRCISKEQGEIWGIPSGTLQQVDGVLELKGHEHIQDTLDGGFADFLVAMDGKPLERWPGHFQQHDQLPLPWRATPTNDQSAVVSASQKLPGRCLCGSVRFWIARPSDRSARAQAQWPDLLIPYHSTEPRPDQTQAWWLRQNNTKYLAGVCACDSCRLASGNEFVEWAFIPTVDISLDESGTKPFEFDLNALQEYRSTPGPDGARRYFCKKCSAMVFWDGDSRSEVKDVAIGLLDAPDGARAESWLDWHTDRVSYREDAHPRAAALVEEVERSLQQYSARHHALPQ